MGRLRAFSSKLLLLSCPYLLLLLVGLAVADSLRRGEQPRENPTFNPKEAQAAELQAQYHNELGVAAEDRGEFQKALGEYRKALEIWPKAHQPAMEARTLSYLGQMLVTVGQPHEAIDLFNRALHLLQQQDRQDVHFEVLDGAGLAYQDLGNVDRALWTYKQALGRAKEPAELARIHHRLGIVYRDKGDFEQAYQELRTSRRIAHEHGNVRWEAFALADLAHLDDLLEKNEAALRGFDEAFLLFATIGEPLPQTSMLFGRAEALRDLGRLEEALASIERSLKIVEPLRARLNDASLRVGFYSWRQRYSDLKVTLLMDLHKRTPTEGWEIKAFEASDLSRSRSLLDDIAGEPTTRGKALAEIQNVVLDPNTTLLSYFLDDRGSFLWVVNRNEIRAFDLPKRTFIEALADKARSQFFKSEPEVEELSRILLPDGAQTPLRRRLLVSPDGALHAIPFAMLRDKTGRELVFDHVVSSLPSASYLAGARVLYAPRPPAQRQLALLADPVFEADDLRLSHLGRRNPSGMQVETYGGHLDRLPFSRDEANRILNLFPEGSSFTAMDFEASRNTARSAAMTLYQIIHITTHHIASDHPDFAGLVLSRYDKSGRLQDGLLRASEIYKLKLPAELVVLSACGTGLGPRVRGEGPMGLSRAFFHAGAERVLVSMWNVEEEATEQLMTRFYRAMLHDKLPPSDALQAAQVSMAKIPKWRSSRAWSAFVLQGEPR